MNSQKVPQKISTFPTKRFFVDMLTRDIELLDAVLDLLDNCVDGVMRSSMQNSSLPRPYDGFWAKLTFDEKEFKIEDNCGGISLALATSYAFRMGKPEGDHKTNLATVGMYGIGMKRAIFKIGGTCTVLSKSREDHYKVTFSPEWMKNEDWELPLIHITKSPLTENGVSITIKNLHETIGETFNEAHSNFESKLRDAIESHYAFIIHKGFRVTVNGAVISPKRLNLLSEDLERPKKSGLTPFLYRADINGVQVSIAIGISRPTPSQDDDDDERDSTKRSSKDAGITIVCNDRVVLYNNKDEQTGWGEANVPVYHTQFIGISGIVIFNSDDPWKLPITTTKRGIEGQSKLYLQVKNHIREGIKKFTDYTNRWKGENQAARAFEKKIPVVPIEKVLATKPDKHWTATKRSSGGKKLDLALPVPDVRSSSRQIRFSRPETEIRALSTEFFGHSEAKPGEVGEYAFTQCLNKRTKR